MKRLPFRHIAVLVLTALVVVLIGSRVYGLAKERAAARAELGTFRQKNQVIERDRMRIDAEQQFIANPDNLEKELRERLNYHAPGEREIIIVPPQNNPSSSTPTP